jgi:L-iditol 2-dehydrogenase
MRALRLVEPFQFAMVDVPMPDPGPGEVRVRVAYCGICGSDLHSYRGKHPNVHPPIILGHEFAGRIDAVGTGVEASWVGRRVAVEPSLTCGTCWACRSGRYNICENLRVLGNVGAEGAFAEAVTVPVEKAIPLPDRLGWQDGALVEPAAVASRAVERAGSLLEGVVVVGAGPVGLMVTATALALGAPQVHVLEPNATRRGYAASLGAEVHDPVGDPDEVSKVRRAFDGVGAPVVLDCVGTQTTLSMAVQVVRKGGRVVIVGVPETAASLDTPRIQDAEIEVVGTLMYQRRHFEQAVALLARGHVQTVGMVTQVVDLEEAPRAFASLNADPGTQIKVLVRVGGDL